MLTDLNGYALMLRSDNALQRAIVIVLFPESDDVPIT
jgi:hypothetical protein